VNLSHVPLLVAGRPGREHEVARPPFPVLLRRRSIGTAIAPINCDPFMPAMHRPDHLDIDGRLLQLLVAVVEERSVTRAAERLGVTQSAVSHGLDRLRAVVDDPLVVKSGRGIVPTARAEALTRRARDLLGGLRGFVAADAFDPARLVATVRIAANDLQRDLLLPRLFGRLRAAAPGLTLHVVPSEVPSAEMLRDADCHLVVSPRPPEAGDIVQKRLFEDCYRVFYDAAERDAPATRADYEQAEHVTVVRDSGRALDIDRVLAAAGVQRRFVVQVHDFAGVRPFLRGTARIATLPGLLRVDLLRGLAHADVPVACPPMPMYMIWHLRYQTDPMHEWLRRELEAVIAPALDAAGCGAPP
jgi:DNA-binding transcriptional LysR family regulator